ncbi:MAG: class I SAM-dependent methyltransferase [Candidatus Woesearchaeota archaeon]
MKVNLYPGPYHWYLGRFYKRKYEQAAILAKNFLKKSMIVLDVGCGDGRMEELLAPSVKKIIGVDNQERPLQFARLLVTQKNVEFIRNDKKLPVSDSSMDAVVCFDVIEHVPINAVKSFVEEIKRVLKKKGIFVVTTPNRKELRGKLFGHKVDPKHYQEFTIAELQELLRKNGFDIKYTTGIYLPLPIPLVEHFGNVYPFYWLFSGLVELGRVFPNLAETMFIVGVKR